MHPSQKICKVYFAENLYGSVFAENLYKVRFLQKICLVHFSQKICMVHFAENVYGVSLSKACTCRLIQYQLCGKKMQPENNGSRKNRTRKQCPMKELSLFKHSHCKKSAHPIPIPITCHNIAMSALNSTCSLVKVVIGKFWLFGRKENWSICYLAKRVPSLLQECFINHHKTQSKCSLFLLETTARKRKKNNLNQNVNSLFPYHHYFTSSFL